MTAADEDAGKHALMSELADQQGRVGLEADQGSKLCNKLHYENGCTTGCATGTRGTAGQR